MKQSGAGRVGTALGLGLALLLAGGGARAEPIDGKKVAYADPNAPASSHPDNASVTIALPTQKESGKSDGLLDPFRIGAFTGVGFPRPVSVEAFIKVEKVIGLGVEYSLMPSLTVSGIDTQYSAIMGDLRIFPFEDGFFIGVGVGHQHLSAVSTTALPAQLGGGTPGITVDSYIVNPRIGYLATWGWGLTIGIDAGLQIPLAATTTNTVPAGASPDPTGVANLFGKSLLPTVDLLRIGLLL
jgi:hypothetical protein